MAKKQENFENLVEASISMIETKRVFYKKAHCIACGVEFRAPLIAICPDCLGAEADDYEEEVKKSDKT